MIAWLIESPIPRPSDLVVVKGSRIDCVISAATPGPISATETSIACLLVRRASVMIDRSFVLAPSHSVVGSAGPARSKSAQPRHWQTGINLCFDLDLMLRCLRADEAYCGIVKRPNLGHGASEFAAVDELTEAIEVVASTLCLLHELGHTLVQHGRL